MNYKEKLEIIKEMRAGRKTYKEIAEILGVSKQRVHQIYKNYKTTKGYIKNEIKLRDGYKCYVCGGRDDLEVHHKNGVKTDNRPENLMTLCRKCHLRVGEARRELFNVKKDIVNERRLIKKTCEFCGKEFLWREGNGIGKYCSLKCSQVVRRKYKDRKEKWRIHSSEYYHRVLKNNLVWKKKNREYQKEKYREGKIKKLST